MLRFQRVDPRAKPLTKSVEDAGFDVQFWMKDNNFDRFLDEQPDACQRSSVVPLPEGKGIVALHQGTLLLLSTGVRVQCPANTYFRLAPRSGLSLKKLQILGGVIDSGYTGEVKVIAVTGMDNQTFRQGDRVAQRVPTLLNTSPMIEAPFLPTQRQEKGFGSSDVAENKHSVS